jgi:hypothetical protein
MIRIRLMPFNMKNLDFIIIGAPKSGTTTLFYYLREHPRIFLPDDKEQPFFSKKDLFENGWDAFASRVFKDAPSDKLWGKISPQYMTYPHVPERIHQLMPEVKLIACLRNPVDRAFSHHRMNIMRKTEERSISEVLSHQRNNPDSNTYLLCGQYGRILSDFVRYFPSDQLLVHFTDDLDKQPQLVMDSILKYLGLETGFTPANLGKRYNMGGEKQRFSNLIPAARNISVVRRLWKTIPEKNRRKLLFLFRFRMNTVAEKGKPLPQEVRSELIDYYRNDVFELEKILRRKVPWSEFATSTAGVK